MELCREHVNLHCENSRTTSVTKLVGDSTSILTRSDLTRRGQSVKPSSPLPQPFDSTVKDKTSSLKYQNLNKILLASLSPCPLLFYFVTGIIISSNFADEEGSICADVHGDQDKYRLRKLSLYRERGGCLNTKQLSSVSSRISFRI